MLDNVNQTNLVLVSAKLVLQKEQLGFNHISDLLDGFFPAELQQDHPEGVIFLVDDRRFETGNRVGVGRSPFSGIGHRLQSRPGSARQIFPPISEPVASRPESVLSGGKISKVKKPEPKLPSLSKVPKKTKTPPCPRSPKNDGSRLQKYAPFKRAPAKGGGPSTSDICNLKIYGLARDPFLLELVSYDTVKTLRGVVLNLLRTQKLGGKFENDGFRLFSSFPRRLIDDDSMTLADLNFVPNGVIHVM